MLESINYIEQYLIQPIESMLKNEELFPAMVYASIGIETLGALIDDKPIRAKAQSKTRFATALYHLFPNQYGFINKNSFLYEALRNHIAHNLIPSSLLNFIEINSASNLHLKKTGSQVDFVIEQFLKDYLNACRLVITQIENQSIRSKKIAF
ncbi:MAG: hypothetical protein JXR60_10740 [Bacteroidales bacterium]|nr:hypothetical protein [Bacteroidales bacterium]